LDPWHGWFKNVSVPPNGTEVFQYLLNGSAHHLDLKASNALDPPDVTAARKEYVMIMGRWIAEASGGVTPGVTPKSSGGINWTVIGAVALLVIVIAGFMNWNSKVTTQGVEEATHYRQVP